MVLDWGLNPGPPALLFPVNKVQTCERNYLIQNYLIQLINLCLTEYLQMLSSLVGQFCLYMYIFKSGIKTNIVIGLMMSEYLYMQCCAFIWNCMCLYVSLLIHKQTQCTSNYTHILSLRLAIPVSCFISCCIMLLVTCVCVALLYVYCIY